MTLKGFQAAFAAVLLCFAGEAAALENYNMAPFGTATQISTGTFWDNITGYASNAIDGDTNGDYASGSVSHTAVPADGNWWDLDLGEIKFIDSINLWNRTDCCSYRATDYYLMIADKPFPTTNTASALTDPDIFKIRDTGTMGSPSTYTINRLGRYVRVYLLSGENLHMAEVQVIGDDPAPSLKVAKLANKTLNAKKGDVINYTYEVTNNGNMPLSGISISDNHQGYGTPAPVPSNPQLTDNPPLGDSMDANSSDNIWTQLGPGDVVRYTGTYTVVQDDIDLLQ